MRPDGDEGYTEINLSPSREWAAFGFDGYRHGMRPSAMQPAKIDVARGQDTLVLTAELQPPPPGPLPARGRGRFLRIGLSAVIEDDQGALTYWALAHPCAKPDFHHPDSFVLELPA
jgi:hypothetical protein